MKKAILAASCAISISACALPTYEPFTEYASRVASNPTNAIDLCSNGLVAPSGEVWGSLNFSGKATGTGQTAGVDVVVTNMGSASPFTAAALSAILPSTFPGLPSAGQAITVVAYNPSQPGTSPSAT